MAKPRKLPPEKGILFRRKVQILRCILLAIEEILANDREVKSQTVIRLAIQYGKKNKVTRTEILPFVDAGPVHSANLPEAFEIW